MSLAGPRAPKFCSACSKALSVLDVYVDMAQPYVVGTRGDLTIRLVNDSAQPATHVVVRLVDPFGVLSPGSELGGKIPEIGVPGGEVIPLNVAPVAKGRCRIELTLAYTEPETGRWHFRGVIETDVVEDAAGDLPFLSSLISGSIPKAGAIGMELDEYEGLGLLAILSRLLLSGYRTLGFATLGILAAAALMLGMAFTMSRGMGGVGVLPPDEPPADESADETVTNDVDAVGVELAGAEPSGPLPSASPPSAGEGPGTDPDPSSGGSEVPATVPGALVTGEWPSYVVRPVDVNEPWSRSPLWQETWVRQSSRAERCDRAGRIDR